MSRTTEILTPGPPNNNRTLQASMEASIEAAAVDTRESRELSRSAKWIKIFQCNLEFKGDKYKGSNVTQNICVKDMNKI